MKNIKIIGIIVIIGVIGFFSVIKAQDETAPALPPPPTETKSPPITPTISANQELKIGVVNVAEVFSRYTKTKDYEKLLEKDKTREELLIKDTESQMKKLNEELEVLSPTSDLYKEKSEQLTSLTAIRKHKVENWNKYIKAKVNEQTLKLYKDIREAIDKYALENSYIFIFKSDPILPPSEDIDNITQQISIRTVLYSPKSLDITDNITKILNKEK